MGRNGQSLIGLRVAPVTDNENNKRTINNRSDREVYSRWIFAIIYVQFYVERDSVGAQNWETCPFERRTRNPDTSGGGRCVRCEARTFYNGKNRCTNDFATNPSTRFDSLFSDRYCIAAKHLVWNLYFYSYRLCFIRTIIIVMFLIGKETFSFILFYFLRKWHINPWNVVKDPLSIWWRGVGVRYQFHYRFPQQKRSFTENDN